MHPELFLQSLQGENFQTASEFHGKQLRFWTHKSWNCAQNFFCKPCRQRSSRKRLNFTANSFVFGRTNRNNGPRTFFYKSCKAKTSRMRLFFTTNSFVFGRTNGGIAPTTFSVNLAGKDLPECVWISRQIASFLDAQIVELRPQLFL